MFQNHPKIEVKPNRTDHMILLLGWILIGCHAVYVWLSFANLPETIPIHFNIRGEADGFGSKSTIWFILIISFLMYALLAFLVQRVKPWNFNYPTTVTENNAPKIYALGIRMIVLINFAVALLFLVISIMVVCKANLTASEFLPLVFWVLVIGITVGPFLSIFAMNKIPK
ncbi:DUF1648 domain-containing protein [Flagellimonas sp.]|uniref:DUF1648 domain-containing protein n=1 Tax=Flagellimonas sp. TaxID=2058762 RepID=UPI003F4A79C6